MKLKILAIGICLSTFFAFSMPNTEKKQIEVVFFMNESCVICKHYTLTLLELHEKYASQNITFLGLFPAASSSKRGIKKFQDKYGIPFKLILDKSQSISRKYQASVTPEVVVVDKSNENILYRGRIPDSYLGIGEKKQVITHHELEDALQSISNGKEVLLTETTPVGCIISYD